jgi:hypothetical protein
MPKELGPRVLNALDDGTHVKLTGACVWCRKAQEVQVSSASFHKWRSGMHIQNAMPEVSTGHREFIMSGICEPCFDEVTKDPDDK